jgi:hypothetical protein
MMSNVPVIFRVRATEGRRPAHGAEETAVIDEHNFFAILGGDLSSVWQLHPKQLILSIRKSVFVTSSRGKLPI